MKVLSIEQKEQVRKDLGMLLEHKTKIENSAIFGYLTPYVTSQLRILETLAIQAGVFEVVEPKEIPNTEGEVW